MNRGGQYRRPVQMRKKSFYLCRCARHVLHTDFHIEPVQALQQNSHPCRLSTQVVWCKQEEETSPNSHWTDCSPVTTLDSRTTASIYVFLCGAATLCGHLVKASFTHFKVFRGFGFLVLFEVFVSVSLRAVTIIALVQMFRYLT